ncbi:MAG: diaminopropionate ammonia-lyase [Gammaproteobacteria bacterium]|nr:diaminopropionate ammonia-lyase [Gammaproteobacteria bacterium]
MSAPAGNEIFARARLRHHANRAAAPADAHVPEKLREDFSPAANQKALREISAWRDYRPGDLAELGQLAKECGLGAIYYKDESGRFGLGSFKALGGAYAVQVLLQREIFSKCGARATAPELEAGKYREHTERVTAVTATDGNHGRAVAWGAKRFNCNCRIFIHAGVSEARANEMRALGAEVERIDGNYDRSLEFAARAAEVAGNHLVSDTSTAGYTEFPRLIMAGYSVLMSEALAQMNGARPTHVFVQGGVGGLAASVAMFLWEQLGAARPRVIVVEPELAACLFESARRGRPSAVEITRETIMAGLSCGEVSLLAWRALSLAAHDFVTIPDELIAPLMRMLARGEPRLEAGETGVAGLAACMAACAQPEVKAALGLDAKSRVLTIGTEGATDRELYDAILAGKNP